MVFEKGLSRFQACCSSVVAVIVEDERVAAYSYVHVGFVLSTYGRTSIAQPRFDVEVAMNKEAQHATASSQRAWTPTCTNCHAAASLTHSALPNAKHGSAAADQAEVTVSAQPFRTLTKGAYPSAALNTRGETSLCLPSSLTASR